jgi:hypothetical protein
MNEAERQAKAIYDIARAELDEKLAASETRLRQEGVEIIDDCDHDIFKWSYCFRQHVAGRFGTAVIQVCLVYGQIPYTDVRQPIGIGQGSIVPSQDRRYHGQRQLNWDELQRREMNDIVLEAIQQSVDAIVV